MFRDATLNTFVPILQVDFGCGSGSLLDSILSYPTSLEKIVGVDLSQRSLAKASKVSTMTVKFQIDFICYTCFVF